MALVFALGMTVFVLFLYVDGVASSAACMERARFETVLCQQPPPVWMFGVPVGTVVLLSIVIGQIVTPRGGR